MKSKFEPSELSGIEFKPYRAKLYKELARMKAEHADASNPTSFLLISEFQYSDLAGKKIPFLVVGTLKPEWKKYFKSDIKTRKNRDWAMGKCSFGASGEFNFEVNAGRITNTWINIIDKLLLNPAKFSANVVEKLIGDGENVELDADDEATAPTQEAAAPAAPTVSNEADAKSKKTTKEKVAKALKSKIEDAGAMFSDMLGEIKNVSRKVQQEIAPKIKNKQDLIAKDFIVAKNGQDVCLNFIDALEKAPAMVKKLYKKGLAEVQQMHQEFHRVSAFVKEKKMTLGQKIANTFYNKQFKRDASEAEAKLMHNNLKAAIAAHVDTIDDKAMRAKMLNTVVLAASARGPKFTKKDIDVVAAATPQ